MKSQVSPENVPAEYPEHKKLQAVVKESNAIGAFLEWLQGTKGYRLAQWMKVPDESEFASETDTVDDLVQQHIDINQILAEYYHIDLAKLEQEKRAMLDEMRAMNQKRESQ